MIEVIEATTVGHSTTNTTVVVGPPGEEVEAVVVGINVAGSVTRVPSTTPSAITAGGAGTTGARLACGAVGGGSIGGPGRKLKVPAF